MERSLGSDRLVPGGKVCAADIALGSVAPVLGNGKLPFATLPCPTFESANTQWKVLRIAVERVTI